MLSVSYTIMRAALLYNQLGIETVQVFSSLRRHSLYIGTASSFLLHWAYKIWLIHYSAPYLTQCVTKDFSIHCRIVTTQHKLRLIIVNPRVSCSRLTCKRWSKTLKRNLIKNKNKYSTCTVVSYNLNSMTINRIKYCLIIHQYVGSYNLNPFIILGSKIVYMFHFSNIHDSNVHLISKLCRSPMMILIIWIWYVDRGKHRKR